MVFLATHSVFGQTNFSFSTYTNNLNYNQNQWDCYPQNIYKEDFIYENLGGEDSWGIADTIIKDFNDDGHCDVYISLYGENETLKKPFVLYLYNPETGNLENNSDLINNNIGQPYTRKSMSADFNNDGRLDVINVSHPELFIYEKSFLDLVLSNDAGWNQITLDSLSRARTAEERLGMDPGYLHGIAIGDLDNDGDVDFVTTGQDGDVMKTYLNNGDASFQKFPATLGDLKQVSYTNELYDINKDGCLDMIYGFPELYIAFGNCDGTFGPLNQNFSSSFVANYSNTDSQEILDFMDYEFHDLDRDGDEDLIINTGENINAYDEGQWRLYFFRNEGTNTDGTINLQDISSQVNQTLIAQGFYVDRNSGGVNYTQLLDVNQDGIMDIIPKKIPGGSRRYNFYHPNWVLYGDNNWGFNYSFYPQYMNAIQMNIIENNTPEISWDIVVPNIQQCFKDLSLGYDRCEQVHYSNTRMGTEWIIYFSNNSFTNKLDSSVSSAVISIFEEETIDDNLLNYVKRYQSDLPDDISSGSYYFRITHRDQYNLESSLSEAFQLTVRRDSDNDGVLDEEDQCLNTPPSVSINILGCEVFNLPQNNYAISVENTSCIGENDGSISVSVEDESISYALTIDGANPIPLNSSTGYNQSIADLSPGMYTLCFTVDNWQGYSQCFEINITEPAPLSATSKVNMDNKTISFDLSGADEYTIKHNGDNYIFNLSNPRLTLKEGLNFIEVKTDKHCQGTYTKEIFISQKVEYYPNPTQDYVTFYLHGEDKSMDINVLDRYGNTTGVFCKKIDSNRKVTINLLPYPKGVYMIQLKGNTIEKTIKIIKE